MQFAFGQVRVPFFLVLFREPICAELSQERLPGTDEDWEAYPRTRMLLKPVGQRQPGGGPQAAPVNQDGLLPHAEYVASDRFGRLGTCRTDMRFLALSVCFFNVGLPAYSSLAVTRERLLQVVNSDWGTAAMFVEFACVQGK